MLRQKEIENVSKLEAFERYKYFIKKVVDFEECWILKNDNNDLAFSEIGTNVLVVSFWPAPEFAKSCQNGVWNNYHPEKVTLNEFENKILPSINEKGYLVDIFPVNNLAGFIVSVEELIRDIVEEFKKYE